MDAAGTSASLRCRTHAKRRPWPRIVCAGARARVAFSPSGHAAVRSASDVFGGLAAVRRAVREGSCGVHMVVAARDEPGHGLGCGDVHLLEQGRVGVGGDLDAGVTEEFGDELEVAGGPVGERRRAVAQVVQPDRIGGRGGPPRASRTARSGIPYAEASASGVVGRPRSGGRSGERRMAPYRVRSRSNHQDGRGAFLRQCH
jgi:hypothetical protein